MAKREHTYHSGRIQRAGQGAPQNRPAGGTGGQRPPAKRRRKRGFPKVLAVLMVFVLLIGAGVGVAYGYLDKIFDTGLLGRIVDQKYVPKEYSKKDVLHILIVGIDNEEGRNYGAGLGMTDMILYVEYDLVNNSMNMLQIPRDSYVGEELPTGGSGKINALLISGPDKNSPINNLVAGIEQQFKLPIDHYVAMDMDALKSIVNTFGGLRVYVPRDMSYGGSSLQQGWQWLDGDAVEFFVRNRHGAGFERADIDRLDNQRHFYSALFRRFMNLTPTDIVNLLPVFEHYCNTDIPLTDIFDIAVSALKLTPESVMFCKIPGATGPQLDPTGRERSLYFIDVYGRGTEEEPGTANLLNQYFRTYGEQVSAEELGLPNITIPSNVTLYPPNVQFMGQVQEGEGGADIDVEPQVE